MLKYLFCILLLSNTIAAHADDKADARASATGSYNQYIAPAAGTNINNNPLISGGELKSLDGERSFTISGMQNSGKTALKVTAIPNFGTGDILKVVVEQDLDGDGTIETISNFPTAADSGKLISGVCSNGYVACTPGTYSNCNYQKWAVDTASGAIAAAQQPTISGLTNCYCYNNHCSTFTNSIILNLDSLVSDFGGGILTAFLEAHTDFAFSSASASSGTISYNGIKTTKPAAAPAAPVQNPVIYSAQAPGDIQGYYQDIGPLDGVGQGEINAQKASPNSMYNIVKGVADNQPGVSLKSCTMTKNTSIEIENRIYKTDDIVEATSSDHYIYLTYDRVGETGLTVHLSTYSYQGNLEQSRDLGTVNFTPDTPDYANGFELTQVDMNYKLVGAGCSNLNNTITWFKGVGAFPMTADTVCSGGGVQSFTITTSATFTFSAQKFVHTEQNGCAIYETDPTCRLKDEKWDTRDTVFNFMPTGFQMSQNCQTINGPIRATQFCRDWWKKDRTYSCVNNLPPYTFDKSRVAEARNTATLTGDTMTYTDGGEQKSYVIGAPPGDLPCEQICKVKMPSAAAVISTTATATDVKTETSLAAAGYKFFFRSCLADQAGNPTCPTETGETIDEACSCTDQKAFGEVMGGLSAISSIKRDSICSAVLPTPTQ